MTPNNTEFYDESNNVLQIISNTYEDGLGKIVFDKTIIKIGDRTFYNCISLKTISIPDNVLSIGISTFYNCWQITDIKIPNCVTSIGASAFNCCNGLTNIVINTTEPPSLGINCFKNINSSAKFYVPSESVEKYKAAEGWKDYANKIQAIES